MTHFCEITELFHAQTLVPRDIYVHEKKQGWWIKALTTYSAIELKYPFLSSSFS